MSGITLAQAQAQLDALVNAVANGMLSVSIGGRSVSYRSLSEINEAITFWESRVNALTRIQAGQPGLSIKYADFRTRR